MRRVMRHPVRFLRHPAPFSCRAPDRGQRSRPMRSTSPSSSGGRCARRRRRKGLLTIARYKGATCNGGNPCARGKEARLQGARAGRGAMRGGSWGIAGGELGQVGTGVELRIEEAS